MSVQPQKVWIKSRLFPDGEEPETFASKNRDRRLIASVREVKETAPTEQVPTTVIPAGPAPTDIPTYVLADTKPEPKPEPKPTPMPVEEEQLLEESIEEEVPVTPPKPVKKPVAKPVAAKPKAAKPKEESKPQESNMKKYLIAGAAVLGMLFLGRAGNAGVVADVAAAGAKKWE